MFGYVNDVAYEYGMIINIEQFCWEEGYYTHEWIEDADGNAVDDEYYISRYDLQQACDALGIPVDCLNY